MGFLRRGVGRGGWGIMMHEEGEISMREKGARDGALDARGAH